MHTTIDTRETNIKKYIMLLAVILKVPNKNVWDGIKSSYFFFPKYE